MSEQAPKVEWVVVESDADWERLALPMTVSPDSSHLHRQRSSWIAIPLLLLLAGVGGWWCLHQASLSKPVVQMMTTAQPALSTVAPGDDPSLVNGSNEQMNIAWWLRYGWKYSDLPTAIQATSPAAHLTVASEMVYLQDNQAAVRVVIYTDPTKQAYRQTRFYQRTDAGWQQTEPDPALWGAERTLTTSYFVYHFRENDAPAVVAVTSQVDALYATIQRNLGLPLNGDAKKLNIDVRVTQTPGNTHFQLHDYEHFVMEDRLIVASPARYLAPIDLTDAQLLAQSIALPLLDNMMAQVVAKNAIGASWQPLLNGLHLWQVWEMNLPLAMWRVNIVKWLYADLTNAHSGYPVVLPVSYAELCIMHKLWLLSPQQIDIPLSCTDLDRQAWYFFSWGQHDPPIRLNRILLAPLQSNLYELTNHRGQTIALATLIEYTVATYGHKHLPILVAGLGQSTSWETLIPAVYGVTVAEFEVDWQKYLGAHYGVFLAMDKSTKK